MFKITVVTDNSPDNLGPIWLSLTCKNKIVYGKNISNLRGW